MYTLKHSSDSYVEGDLEQARMEAGRPVRRLLQCSRPELMGPQPSSCRWKGEVGSVKIQ